MSVRQVRRQATAKLAFQPKIGPSWRRRSFGVRQEPRQGVRMKLALTDALVQKLSLDNAPIASAL